MDRADGEGRGRAATVGWRWSTQDDSRSYPIESRYKKCERVNFVENALAGSKVGFAVDQEAPPAGAEFSPYPVGWTRCSSTLLDARPWGVVAVVSCSVLHPNLSTRRHQQVTRKVVKTLSQAVVLAIKA